MLFLSGHAESLRHSTEEWSVEAAIKERNKQEKVENVEKDDSMYRKHCHVDEEVSELFNFLQRVYAISEAVPGVYQRYVESSGGSRARDENSRE